MRNMKRNLSASLTMALFCVLGGFSLSANAQARKAHGIVTSDFATQQPLYAEYKGVHLGMTAGEARAKFGTPALQESDQDYYIFSDKETAQIAYNTKGIVVTISVDYLGGVGAPDYKAVVGGELERTTSGGLYRVVRYERQGFWVSYNRSSGPVVTVTITIQKM